MQTMRSRWALYRHAPGRAGFCILTPHHGLPRSGERRQFPSLSIDFWSFPSSANSSRQNLSRRRSLPWISTRDRRDSKHLRTSSKKSLTAGPIFRMVALSRLQAQMPAPVFSEPFRFANNDHTALKDGCATIDTLSRTKCPMADQERGSLMAATPSPLTQVDGFYYAPNGTALNFALSSAHGYLTIWTVTYGGTAVNLTPASPTANPAFGITVMRPSRGAGNVQALHVIYNPLAGGPGQEDVVTLSLVLPAGNSVIYTQPTTYGFDFVLSISAT